MRELCASVWLGKKRVALITYHGPNNYHAAEAIIGTHKSNTGEGHALRRPVHAA
jgi:hypothetical protein